MAQEPPQPNIIAAGHMAVAGGVPKPQSGCSTTPVWPGHLHLLHVKRASSPAPAKGWAAAENSSFTPKTRNYEATKYEDFFVCKYLSQHYCPSSSICPHVPTTERHHRQPPYTCNYLFPGTLSSGPICWGQGYWTLQANAPAGSLTHSVWVAKQTWKATTFNPKSEILMCPSTLFFFFLIV